MRGQISSAAAEGPFGPEAESENAKIFLQADFYAQKLSGQQFATPSPPTVDLNEKHQNTTRHVIFVPHPRGLL